MYYTSLIKVSSSMEYHESKAKAVKEAKSHDMTLKIESDGYFLKSRKIEVVIREHNSMTDQVLRECDPRPFLMKRRPDFTNVDLDNRVATLLRKLNQGKTKFEDVMTAAKEAKEEVAV